MVVATNTSCCSYAGQIMRKRFNIGFFRAYWPAVCASKGPQNHDKCGNCQTKKAHFCELGDKSGKKLDTQSSVICSRELLLLPTHCRQSSFCVWLKMKERLRETIAALLKTQNIWVTQFSTAQLYTFQLLLCVCHADTHIHIYQGFSWIKNGLNIY